MGRGNLKKNEKKEKTKEEKEEEPILRSTCMFWLNKVVK